MLIRKFVAVSRTNKLYMEQECTHVAHTRLDAGMQDACREGMDAEWLKQEEKERLLPKWKQRTP